MSKIRFGNVPDTQPVTILCSRVGTIPKDKVVAGSTIVRCVRCKKKCTASPESRRRLRVGGSVALCWHCHAKETPESQKLFTVEVTEGTAREIEKHTGKPFSAGTAVGDAQAIKRHILGDA